MRRIPSGGEASPAQAPLTVHGVVLSAERHTIACRLDTPQGPRTVQLPDGLFPASPWPGDEVVLTVDRDPSLPEVPRLTVRTSRPVPARG